MSVLRTAYINVLPKTDQFDSQLKSKLRRIDVKGEGERHGRAFGTSFARASTGPFRAMGGLVAKSLGGVVAGLGAVAGIHAFAGFISDARDSAKVAAVTASTIKATGGAAKVTAEQVGNLATAISNKTGKDDEAVQSGQNMLLTFKNIKNAAGANNDIFNQSSAVLTDMVAAMNGGNVTEQNMSKGAIQLGKALNDPIKGIGALSRVGVTFTEAQKKQIAAMVQAGNVAGAQKIILAELRSEFGGAAAASSNAGERMQVAMGNAGEAIGGLLLPVVDRLAGFVSDRLVPGLFAMIAAFRSGTVTSTGFSGVMERIGVFARAAWPVVRDLAAQVGTVLVAAFRAAAGVIGPVVGWLNEHRRVAVALAVSIGALVAIERIHAAVLAVQAAGGIVKYIASIKIVTVLTRAWAAVQWLLNAALTANPIGIVVVALAALVAGLVVAYKHSATFRAFVDKLWVSIKTAWTQMRAVIGAVSSWFTGTIIPSIKTAIGQANAAWNALRSAVAVVWSAIRAVITTQWAIVRGIFLTIRSWLTILGTVFRTFAQVGAIAWRTLGAGIRAVWDSVRSGSFAPLRTFITQTLPNAFRTGVSAIRAAWSRIQEAARTPVAFVVNHVINPLIGGYNRIAGVFHAPKASTIGGFAEGGRIPGMPSSIDNRLAQLMGPAGKALGTVKVATGEFIVNARDTQKALPLLNWINQGMKGGSRTAAKYIGRTPIDAMGDGSEGWGFRRGGQVPGYADGGLVGFFKNALKTIAGVTTYVPRMALSKVANATLDRMPGTGPFATAVKGLARNVINGVNKWFDTNANFGGANVPAAQNFVRAQAGKPYIWASAGPRGYDCSGIVSAVYNVLSGKRPYSHTFSTGSLPGPWFREGVRAGSLVAGWSHPGQSPASSGTGHMAGMVGGLPFESRGSRGVVVGNAARKVSQFAHIGAGNIRRSGSGTFANGGLVGGVPIFDTGGVLAPGFNTVYNATGRSERVAPVGHGDIHIHLPNAVITSKRQAVDLVVEAVTTAKKERRL